MELGLYNVADFAFHGDMDEYSVSIAHDEDFDALAIDLFGCLLDAYYRGSFFDMNCIACVVV